MKFKACDARKTAVYEVVNEVLRVSITQKFAFYSLLFFEREVDRQEYQHKRYYIVPAESLGLEECQSQHRKDNKRDTLLNDFQLKERERTATAHKAYPIGGNCQAVLKKGNTPTKQYDDK